MDRFSLTLLTYQLLRSKLDISNSEDEIEAQFNKLLRQKKFNHYKKIDIPKSLTIKK